MAAAAVRAELDSLLLQLLADLEELEAKRAALNARVEEVGTWGVREGGGGTPGKPSLSAPLSSAGLALAVQSSLRHGRQVGGAPAVRVPHGAPGVRVHQVRSLVRWDGGGGVRAGRSEIHAPLSLCSEEPDGLQRFRVVRAAAQAPEDVGPRESGEPPFPPGTLPAVKARIQSRRLFCSG